MKKLSPKSLNKGDVIIISSPSGAGKSTIAKNLLKKIKNSKISISCTTRKPRSYEKNGKDYFFISKKKFFLLKKKNKFLETEKVFDNYYGTLRNQVTLKKKNKTIFLDVDWKGARKLRNKFKKNCFSIFLLPPSIKKLKQRLLKRHSDNKEIGFKRLTHAKRDIKHWNEYDYVAVNDNLNKCVKKIQKKIFDIKNNDKEKKRIKKTINKLLNSKLR